MFRSCAWSRIETTSIFHLVWNGSEITANTRPAGRTRGRFSPKFLPSSPLAFSVNHCCQIVNKLKWTSRGILRPLSCTYENIKSFHRNTNYNFLQISLAWESMRSEELSSVITTTPDNRKDFKTTAVAFPIYWVEAREWQSHCGSKK